MSGAGDPKIVAQLDYVAATIIDQAGYRCVGLKDSPGVFIVTLQEGFNDEQDAPICTVKRASAGICTFEAGPLSNQITVRAFNSVGVALDADVSFSMLRTFRG